MRFRLRTLLAVTSVTAIVTAVSWKQGLVTLEYERGVDNQPLRNPVRVVDVLPNGVLVLADGRKVWPVDIWLIAEADPSSGDDRIRRQLHRSPDWLVDVEEMGPPRNDGVRDARVYYRGRVYGCGLVSWKPVLSIPLIPRERLRYWRLELRVRNAPEASEPIEPRAVPRS